MVFLISGATHTGKTLLAQRLLEKYKYPCLSIDHLKMGLIRSGQTELTPYDSDESLTEYLWPIVCEMVKTAVENRQNLIVEGCYIPFDYSFDFGGEYLQSIKYVCLVMSRKYIQNHFNEIKATSCAAESRLEDSFCTPELLIRDNERYLRGCIDSGCRYILIDTEYPSDLRDVFESAL